MLKKISSYANIKVAGNYNFLTPKAELAFLRLREAFIEALIVHSFDLKRYIEIKIDRSSYAIGDITS